MQLLMVRHARAGNRETFAATGRPDSERPLTGKGIRRMRKAAHGLRLLVPSIDLLASSPLRRTIETARIIADAYGGIALIERDELAPGADSDKFIDWLAAQQPKETVCIVGHEPDLSELLALLLSRESEPPPTKLKKGAACLVSFDSRFAAANGSLRWYRSSGALGSQG